MKNVLYFIKQIYSYSGKILYINMVAMILISLFEGIGIFLLLPLINLTGILEVVPEERYPISWVFNFLQGIPQNISLPLILISYVLLIIGQSFFQRNQSILNAKIHQGFIRHLREGTYRSLLEVNWGFYLKKRKSDIINLMTNEIGRVSGGTNMVFQFIASILYTLIQIGIALWLSAKMTIFVLCFGFVLIFFSRRFIRKSNSLGEDTFQYSKMYLAGITDHFNGIKDIKSNSLEESHVAWIKSVSRNIEHNMIDMISVRTNSQLTYKVVSALLITTFMFFSVKYFQAQPAQLMLIIIIFSRLWPRFTSIQSNLEQIGSIAPSFKALIDLQNECILEKEIKEDAINKTKPIFIQRGIECSNIYFRYDRKQPVFALQNINVYIPANQMTAIVGRSGAGKSTLIDLLLGLNHPEEGIVLIDGRILSSDILLSLRKSISYVPQDPFLFNATIRENLLIVKENSSEEQLWEALEFAVAADFVNKLPEGLDTLIGDRGIRLSGGERQRLVLARSILRRPSILILDEATSALDTENEAKIQEALEKLHGKMTIIIIAHSLSTIQNADQVIVLDQGRIIQTGGFRQLANEQEGLFQHLLGKQMEICL